MTRPTDSSLILWWALTIAAAATLASLLLSGCGASAIQSHARAATAVGVTLTEARATLLDARAADLDAVERETDGQEPAARLAAVDARSDMWAPALAGWNLCREAASTWVESIALAHAAGGGEDLLAPVFRLAVRVLALWPPVVALASELGADLPRLPDVLSGLLGGGS